MQQNSENIELLYPQTIDWNLFSNQVADVPFSDEIVSYLNALSSSLLKDRESRMYPDVVTFAFFCRKANLLEFKKKYDDLQSRLGRGLLFHIAPSNVPINFGYSLVAGLLAGNNNVVRVSSKQFPQVDLVIKHIQILSQSSEYSTVSKRIALVRYGHTSDANDLLSSLCNVRIIWGGDATIVKIRQSNIPPRSFDVCFADRYSMAIMNADVLSTLEDCKGLAEKFYNDTYLFDQNACSAPHLVVWLGDKDKIALAQTKFWTALRDLVETKYNFQSVMSIDKLTAFYKQAVAMNVRKVTTPDNLVCRVDLQELPNDIDDYRCATGYFSEYVAQSINEIVPIIKNKYQTLAYYGFDRDYLQSFVSQNKPKGFDRIVPIGETTSFSLIWDGYDLIRTFSRVIDIL